MLSMRPIRIITIICLLSAQSCAPSILGEVSPFTLDGVALLEHRIFISSHTYLSGNLGGVAGADNKCTELARQAGLSRNYKALLTLSGVDLSQRIKLTGAVYIFSSASNKILVSGGAEMLTGADLFSGMSFTERYQSLGTNAVVWTGSDAVGNSNQTCADWTSANSLDSGSETLSGLTQNPLFAINLACDAIAGSLAVRIFCISQ